MLYGRRGEKEEFTLLAKQLVSPLVDGRANLLDGAPETREYRAQFFRNDTAVGQMSDILVLTVPAGGVAKAAATAAANVVAESSALKAAA